MTFEEWFEQRFPANTPEGSAARTGQFKDYLEEAWYAGKGRLSALDGLPGMDGYTYEEFSRDSHRW